jgi:hypothetical protein
MSSPRGQIPKTQRDLDGKDVKGVALLLGDEPRIEGDVDAYKGGDGEEGPAHHTEEAKKCDGIKAKLVEQDGLLDMNEGETYETNRCQSIIV